jgi:hypothetical protein
MHGLSMRGETSQQPVVTATSPPLRALFQEHPFRYAVKARYWYSLRAASASGK